MRSFVLAFVLVLALFNISETCAQNTLGGHIGFVKPIVEFAGGATNTLIDKAVIGFPMGVTIKPGGDFSYDLEIVPFAAYTSINRVGTVATYNLLIHPGVVYNAGFATLGLRGAWESSGVVGFTPLINKGLFALGDKATVFGELWLPVRFAANTDGSARTIVGIALHFGVGF
jgi:hypothetical protein